MKDPLSARELPPEEIAARLLERARALAEPLPAPRLGRGQPGLLEFQLGPDRYGVETRHVREVVPTETLTPLPGTPPYLLGILAVRGRVWSVVDLRALFGIPKRGLSDHPRAILVEAGGLRWGIMADSKLRLLDGSQLAPPPDFTRHIPPALLKGVTHDRALVLDLEELARDPRMTLGDDAAGPPPLGGAE